MIRYNSERAERAQSALNQYINHTGDDPNANDQETWLKDMFCDLRHLANQGGLDIETAFSASVFNYTAELEEEAQEVEEAVAND